MTDDAIQTRCPACHTVFEVDKTILQRASGMVRCGDCLHVFDALANADTDIPILRKPTAPEATVAIHTGSTAGTHTETEVEPNQQANSELPPDPADIFEPQFDPAATGTAVDFELPEPADSQNAGDGNIDFELGGVPDNGTSDATGEDAAILDFDLGVGETASVSAGVPDDGVDFDVSEPALSGVPNDPPAIDFDLGSDSETAHVADNASLDSGHAEIDFEIGQTESDTDTSDSVEPESSAADSLRDGTGRFLFSDDIPEDLLDAELEQLSDGALPEPPAEILETSSSPADAGLTETISGEDWDDLLSEIGDEPQAASSKAEDLSLESIFGDETKDEPAAATEAVDAPSIEDEPSLADALFEGGELRLDDAVDEPYTADVEPAADVLASPNEGSLDAATPEEASGEDSESSIVELSLEGEAATTDTEDAELTTAMPPAQNADASDAAEPSDEPLALDDDEDKTRMLDSGPDHADDNIQDNAFDDDATKFLPETDTAAKIAEAVDEDATRLIDDHEELINEASDTFDTHALSDMLAASEVFLNTDAPSPQEADASAGEQEAVDENATISNPSDDAPVGETLAATPDAESDSESVFNKPQDEPVADVAIPDDAPVGEEIILETEPEPIESEPTPEDMFAESMILMSEGSNRRRGLWSALSVLLIIGLASQAIHLFRGEIATTSPWGDYLKTAYQTLGLPLEERWNINNLCILRSGSSLGETSLDIETVFENRSERAAPLPVIKVDITDNFDDVIATATVASSDYLPAADQRLTINAGQRVAGLLELAYSETRADKFELSLCYANSDGSLRCGAAICGAQ